ncbi:MAG: hypothetical protein U0P30_03555 [Vicinamibacterales bacterium]
MTAALAGLALLGLVQLVLLWKLARSTRATAEATDRVAQLTSALALLTDTMEEGFVNVASELERLGAKPTPAVSTRRATTRRIAASLKKGLSVEDIAIAEGVSESEVRLHLGLEAATPPAPEPVAVPVESEAPGVLDDLEQWMHTLGRKTRARGGRHAVVRV